MEISLKVKNIGETHEVIQEFIEMTKSSLPFNIVSHTNGDILSIIAIISRDQHKYQ